MGFKSKGSESIGLLASPTTVSDTVASGTTHTVIGLSVANKSASPITAAVKLNKAGGASVFLLPNATIAVGGTEVVVGGDHKVVLEAGDTITAYASASSAGDVALSYLV